MLGLGSAGVHAGGAFVAFCSAERFGRRSRQHGLPKDTPGGFSAERRADIGGLCGSLTGGGYRFPELVEQVLAVVGARGCFRVILHAEGVVRAMADSRDRIIVQVAMRDFQLGRQRFFLDREAVILGGDFDFAGDLVQHGLVGTTVSKLELEGFGSAGERQQLMPKANAKDGTFAEQFADGLVSVREGLGIAGAVGQENTGWIHGENFLGRCGAGEYGNLTTKLSLIHI